MWILADPSFHHAFQTGQCTALPHLQGMTGKLNGRLEIAPTHSITDDKYETGLDYLGYWLKQASVAWANSHGGAALEKVDIIAHSTGGLVARSYIQSNVYGVGLPKVDNLVLVGVPNQGGATSGISCTMTSTPPSPPAPRAWSPIAPGTWPRRTRRS